ncbi:MAG: hypothetical protein WCT12_19745 [Verrucomicrobiota bacterium]
MNATHLLRIEGVNLANFVFDTRDLSTARGGSLMLLDAIPEVIDILKFKVGRDKVGVLSQGASSGLFEIETSDPAGVAEAVEKLLANAKWSLATFVVDVLPVSTPFRDGVEGLLAANRWRQMQAATLALPRANSTNADPNKPACGFDGLRPAINSGSDTHKVRDRYLSDSVWQRREYGRSKKQSFYQKTGIANLPAFAEDFAAIATGIKPLDGKLAIFYADGNSFGGIQASKCDSPEKQEGFDKYIRRARETFLKQFLQQEVMGKPGDWHSGKGTRFETLLWGGDEVMFVMPARLGWRFATFFFDQMKDLNLDKAKDENQESIFNSSVPLTHAAALVFCQHHAPIHRIKHLAKDQMAEFAKATDRTRDSLMTVALESFDHLGADYQHAMNQRYKEAVLPRDMILVGDGELTTRLREIATHADKLRNSDSFARSQLRALVNEMLRHPSGAAAAIAAFKGKSSKAADGTSYHEPPDYFRNASVEEKVRLHQKLRPLFPTDLTLWLQLEELWDYALL